MDFTLTMYRYTLSSLLEQDFSFYTFYDSINKLENKSVILRHDVDRLPQNALKIAKIESSLNIKATYYFRTVKHVFKPEIITEISAMGHEIGYHYEDFTLARGDFTKAIQLFERNLHRLRKITDIKTLCMHGSPFSKWDNREIWSRINYKDYNLFIEPYFDIDYNEFFYITDTGRKWNNLSINIRDKVQSKFDIKLKDSYDIINKIIDKQLPDKIIINSHPHRWFDPGFMWYQELLFQNVKNIIKRFINIMRN